MNKPHKYDYNVNQDSQTAPAKVVRMVGSGRRVLEIGAGPGSITKILKTAGNCRVTALEIDSEAIIKLTPFCESVYQADLNQSGWIDRIKHEGKFDVVIAADVLEHVYEPSAVLSGMKEFIAEDGFIVVSLPHVGHSAIHACMFQEDFEYRNWGLLDRTHIRFFGVKNMQALFETAGLKIIHAEFVLLAPENTEFASRWAGIPEDLRRALSQNPFGSVYQVVIKAVPLDFEGQAISLIDLPVDMPALVSSPRLDPRYSARKLLPGWVKSMVRRVASKVHVKL